MSTSVWLFKSRSHARKKGNDIVVLFDELIRSHHLATTLVTQVTQGGGNAAQDLPPQHPEWG